MSEATWILERCENERFPYRLRIVHDGKPFLTLRTQDRWPAANRNIFCLREKEAPDDVVEEVESVPIVSMQRRGVRLSVVLDRKRYKRCDFLFLTRPYRSDPARTYEQIFWQTQASMRQRRPRVKLSNRTAAAPYTVRIAHDERYPWRFPGAEVERGKLPSGDYALADGDSILALVERKTFENLLADFGTMQVLHQRLLELSGYEQHALVIEAAYEDFLNPRKVHHYSPAFCARALAELAAEHPRLRTVFCANRKTANEWTKSYFEALWARISDEREGATIDSLAEGRDGEW